MSPQNNYFSAHLESISGNLGAVVGDKLDNDIMQLWSTKAAENFVT